MSQKKLKKKGQDVPPAPVEDVPTKQDYSIASYMKKNTPTKRTKFLHHQVNYFYASKAVDCLLDSEWATGKDAIFTDRQSVVLFCNRLLRHKFFHRAKKVPITDRDLKPKELKKKREKEEKEKSRKEKKKKKDTESKDESEDCKKDDEATHDEDDTKKKKKKQKIKLDMHLEQVFVDGSDAYVWMYDPIPFWYYIAGALCLLAAVAICLFPLWPPSVRKGVYYLSVLAAGFLGVILSLAVIRFVFFMLIWVLSMGRHHLWLLPNLTEDVGFLASFWPLYHYEYRGADYDRKKAKKTKKKVTLKTSETEEDGNKCDDKGGENVSAGETDRQETDGERRDDHTSNQSATEDSDISQHSQPFEMVDREDLDDRDDDDDDQQDEDQEDEESARETDQNDDDEHQD